MSKWEVDKAVEQLAKDTPELKFYPTLIQTKTNMKLSSVFERLLELVKDNRLSLKWENKCLCCKKINTDEKFEDDNYQCKYCNSKYKLELDNIFPCFGLTKEYVEYINNSKRR